MSLQEKDVAHIAKLARIKVSTEELPHYTREISGIMAWIEQLAEVNTDDVLAVASVTKHTLPMRADVVTDGDMQADILRNAPKSEYGCFVVPKVIDQG
jgi:aspartyl-tRNA(Asn)/glutamyl-tRNA(Gln) amidotransferase subunit C